jgi:hypothetical protein
VLAMHPEDGREAATAPGLAPVKVGVLTQQAEMQCNPGSR